MEPLPHATGPARHPADGLWARFRSRAERVLAREPRPWGDAHHDAVRGLTYLVLVDLVADLVDRIEQVEDPAIRDGLVDLVSGERVCGDPRR